MTGVQVMLVGMRGYASLQQHEEAVWQWMPHPQCVSLGRDGGNSNSVSDSTTSGLELGGQCACGEEWWPRPAAFYGVVDWKLGKRRLLPSDVTDFVTVEVNGATPKEVGLLHHHLLRHPQVKACSMDASIHRRSLLDSPDSSRQLLWGIRGFSSPVNIPESVSAQAAWDLGITGERAVVALFDTGLSRSHPSFKNVLGVINFTTETTEEDPHGHGTFVAGVVASNNPRCPGIAQDAGLMIFKVFTSAQVTYTSWLLDAFNHALFMEEVDIINLSMGGSDYADQPFVDKVQELSANGKIIVSAIGNSGPRFGDLANPGDQMDVIGVGGVDVTTNPPTIARFSSRGMTTWELRNTFTPDRDSHLLGRAGRTKPDVLAPAVSLHSVSPSGPECRVLSGTSVASPVVAGIVALLVDALKQGLPEEQHARYINVASVRNLLGVSATALPSATLEDPTLFEQGHGIVNLPKALSALSDLVLEFDQLAKSFPWIQFAQPVPPSPSFSPQVFPDMLDLRAGSELCTSLFPLCSRPLYFSRTPLTVNLTLSVPNTVTSHLGKVTFEQLSPKLEEDSHASLLDVRFSAAEVLWPYTGSLAVHISTNHHGAGFTGDVFGVIRIPVFAGPVDASHEDSTRPQQTDPRHAYLDTETNLKHHDGGLQKSSTSSTESIQTTLPRVGSARFRGDSSMEGVKVHESQGDSAPSKGVPEEDVKGKRSTSAIPLSAPSAGSPIVVLEVLVAVSVIPTPPRQNRVLFSHYHNLQYPPGFVPRDRLEERDELLDANADHLHTNFLSFHKTLLQATINDRL